MDYIISLIIWLAASALPTPADAMYNGCMSMGNAVDQQFPTAVTEAACDSTVDIVLQSGIESYDTYRDFYIHGCFGYLAYTRGMDFLRAYGNETLIVCTQNWDNVQPYRDDSGTQT